MPTFTAFTTLDGKPQADALADALEDLDPVPTGVGVFEIEDDSGLWEVGGYFTEQPDDIGLALLAAVYSCKPFVISDVPDEDWVDKVRRELTPVHAGRFFVYVSHDADKIPDDAEPLLIEAAMAFGTGHHGTTVGCLRALDRLSAQGVVGKNVADVGCGTAVLAMAAARIWPNPVVASDIDPVAVDVAKANVRANDLSGRVQCLESVGFEHPAVQQRAPYDLVFANILKQPLIDLAPDMARFIARGGRAVLSGLLIRQADDVIAAYRDAGMPLEQREDVGEWVTLVVKRS
jgi:ribosomal protein L11 methyltransferase